MRRPPNAPLMPRALVSALLSALLLAGCADDPLDPLRSIRIEVPSTVTFVEPGPTDVAFVVRNTGRRPVALQHCGESLVVYVDLWGGEDWMQLTEVLCPEALAFTDFAAGAEREGFFRLNFAGPARYRLRIESEDGDITSHAIELR